MFAFCEFLVWSLGSISRAQCSARQMQSFGRLNVEISQTIKQLRSFFVKIDELWRCASCRACFQAYYSVHNDLRLKCSSLGVYTSKYLNREENYGHFSTKTTNVRILRVVGLVSRLNTSYTMLCASNSVIGTFNHRNISMGKEITVIFRQNRRMIAFYVLRCLLPRIIQRALCSALEMQ
jgi:hypothetical protein